ncbi:MAG: phosphoribosylanthranilate isomerase, partial [Candidatus Sedimenticola sp. 1PA]
MRCRAKICGITRPEDALEAVHQGADAIGLVFYPPSPRAVSIEQASQVVRVLPPFVTVVGLFVNASEAEISDVLSSVRIDLMQFHGDETHSQCTRYGKPYIKAVRMREGIDLHRIKSDY